MKKITLIIVAIFLVGCSSPNEIVNNNELVEGHFIISPSQLFSSDELKTLEPHLDMRTGCVEIQYNGERKWLSTKYEIWEKGELQSSHKNFAVGMINNKNDDYLEYDGIVSISVKDDIVVEDTDITSTMTMITAIDGSSSKRTIDKYNKNYSSSIYNLSKSIEVVDTEEIAVWALLGIDDNNGGGYSQELTIEETVKKVEWALVLKVYFNDDE